MVEISRPNARAPTRNSDTAASSMTHDPRIGRSNRSIERPTTAIDETSEMKK